MMNSIGDLIAKLEKNSEVVGLLEYGSAAHSDPEIEGDYDLIVVLRHALPLVESLHFRVGGIPVDINLRSFDQIKALEYAIGFDAILFESRVVHDPSGQLAIELEALTKRHERAEPTWATADDIAKMRHGTRHAFDKIHARMSTSPTLCSYILQQNVYWLIRSYFAVREMDFPGEKRALAHLSQHERELHDLVERFYETADRERQLGLSERIADIVLAPVGGMWKDDELLAFGESHGEDGSGDLQADGRRAFVSLFGFEP